MTRSRRFAAPAVLATAAAAVALPVGAAWIATRVPVAPGETATATTVLLTAVIEAPVLLVLGALTGRLLVRESDRLARFPVPAVGSALLALGGLFLAVYLHALIRGRMAGAPGVPPIGLVVQFDDFVRIAPLIPVTLLMALAVGAHLADRGPGPAAAAGSALGLAMGLGGGLAVVLVAAAGHWLGPAGVNGALVVAVLLVALLAYRAGRS